MFDTGNKEQTYKCLHDSCQGPRGRSSSHVEMFIDYGSGRNMSFKVSIFINSRLRGRNEVIYVAKMAS